MQSVACVFQTKTILFFQTLKMGNATNTKNKINKSTVLQAHLKRINKNEFNNYNQDELINILGGIDNILTLLLSCKDIKIENK